MSHKSPFRLLTTFIACRIYAVTSELIEIKSATLHYCVYNDSLYGSGLPFYCLDALSELGG